MAPRVPSIFEGDKLESLMHPLDGVSVLYVADKNVLGAEILAYALSVCKVYAFRCFHIFLCANFIKKVLTRAEYIIKIY